MATALSREGVNGTDERTKPPFLRRVRIRGYKSIAFCDVSLQPLTILVGRNGAGKSNFLDALAFLRDVMKVGVGEAVRIKPRGGWPSLVCRSTGVPRIQIEIEMCFACSRPIHRLMGNSGPFTAIPREAGPLPDLSGATFTANYSLEISAGPHSAPIISKEYLKIVNETGSQTEGFDVKDGIIQ
jgi:AAA ATPase domain